MKRIEILQGDISNGIKPFLADAYESGLVKDGDVHTVIKVKESNGRSGFSIHADSFIAFLFKSSPMCDVLLETLEDLLRTNPAPNLLIEIDSDSAFGFHLGLTEECSVMWTKGKKLGSTIVYSPKPASGTPKAKKKPNGDY